MSTTSGGLGPFLDDVTVRERLRTLIAGGVLPESARGPLWAGRCRVRHRCTICGTSIEVGHIEFEITSPAGVVIFMHRRCFDLWMIHEPGGEADQRQSRPA